MHRVVQILAGVLVATLVAGCASRPTTTAQARPAAVDPAREALAHVERLRTIKGGGDVKAAERLREDAGKYFVAHHAAALPVLRRQLGLESARPVRNDVVLLDLGAYLHERGEPADKALARTALFALDPTAESVRGSRQQLFQFAHAVAADRDPRILGLVDKAFLRGDIAFSAGTPPLKLDATGACAFLLGAYGDGAEAHLRRQLGERAIAGRIIEILIWIGSPASNREVAAALALGDPQLFVRAATFLVKAGGPEGRRTLLAQNPRTMDAASREYYTRIRKDVEGISFAQLRKRFTGLPGDAALAREELIRRLAAMTSGDGVDARTSPVAYLDSDLPRDFLVTELTRARARLFRRVSIETLAAAQRTNDTINALRYR